MIAKQQQQQQKTRYHQIANTTSAFGYLPDEILINIFSQMDLLTLGTIMTTSPRMRQLSLRALQLYRLPATQVAISVDQEGKSRTTTLFEFSHFCPVSYHAMFTAIHPTARRYYTNRGAPTVRFMSIQDDEFPSDSCCAKPLSIVPKQQCNSAFESLFSVPSNVKVTDHKLKATKEGFHVLQVSPKASVSLLSKHKPTWKIAYKITNKQRPEYHLTPMSITMGLELLMELDALDRSAVRPSKQKKSLVARLF